MTASTLRRRPADPVRIRELGPGEVDVLEAVFDGLSPMSRFRRFHGAVPRLTPFMRARLGAVDGHQHIAVAAFVAWEPVGIARLIALGDARAELAVEVVDAWQGCGVGTRLVQAVVERGRAAGHREIVADVLADNVPMRLMLASLFPGLVAADDGPEVTFIATVPEARPAC